MGNAMCCAGPYEEAPEDGAGGARARPQKVTKEGRKLQQRQLSLRSAKRQAEKDRLQRIKELKYGAAVSSAPQLRKIDSGLEWSRSTSFAQPIMRRSFAEVFDRFRLSQKRTLSKSERGSRSLNSHTAAIAEAIQEQQANGRGGGDSP